MKIQKNLSCLWRVLVGVVMSLVGVAQQGHAAIPVRGDFDNMNNVVHPGAYAQKNREVAFEGRGSVKSKGAIGSKPDGTLYGVITRGDMVAGNSLKIRPTKNKAILYMATPAPRTNQVKGKMLESQPDRDAKSDLIAHEPAEQKPKSFIDKPALNKGTPIISTPRRKLKQGKGNLLESQPGKNRLIMNTPRQERQLDKGQMLESSPGKSKAILDGHQSKLDGNGLLNLLPEQQERLVFGSRDYPWILNDANLLERHLPDGIRVVIGAKGMVEVFDSANLVVGQFYAAAAANMDRALRITQEMKHLAQGLTERGNEPAAV